MCRIWNKVELACLIYGNKIKNKEGLFNLKDLVKAAQLLRIALTRNIQSAQESLR